MEKFEIPLKNEKLKSYYRITWIIIFLHSIIYIVLSFSSDKFIRSNALATVALLAVLFLLQLFITNKKWKTGPHVFFMILSIGWLAIHIYWLIPIPFIFDFLFAAASTKRVVKFSSTGIIYPSFPAKKIAWNDLSNLVLKDDLLTIDFKNNRIIQQMIEESATPVDEKIFNEFCREQLKSI